MAGTNSKPGHWPIHRIMAMGRAFYPGNPELLSPSAREVPSLTLRGDWLSKAGFEVGQTLRVYVTHQCLVISSFEDKPPPKP